MKDLEAAVAATLEEIADQSGRGPSLPSAALWRAGRRRRRYTVAAGSAGLATVSALLLMIGGSLGPFRDQEPVAVAPATLATSLELRQVSAVDPGPCPPGSDGLPDRWRDACYHVSGTGVKITRVQSIRLDHTLSDQPSLVVHLLPDDKARFASLTRAIAGLRPPASQLAVIVDGVVVSAPTVAEPLTGSMVVVAAGDVTDMDRIYHSLRPTTPSFPG